MKEFIVSEIDISLRAKRCLKAMGIVKMKPIPTRRSPRGWIIWRDKLMIKSWRRFLNKNKVGVRTADEIIRCLTGSDYDRNFSK